MKSNELIKLAAARIVLEKTAVFNPMWLMAIPALTSLFSTVSGEINKGNERNSPIARLENLMGIGNIMDSMNRSGIGDMFGAGAMNQLGATAAQRMTGQNVNFQQPSPSPITPQRSTVASTVV